MRWRGSQPYRAISRRAALIKTRAGTLTVATDNVSASGGPFAAIVNLGGVERMDLMGARLAPLPRTATLGTVSTQARLKLPVSTRLTATYTRERSSC